MADRLSNLPALPRSLSGVPPEVRRVLAPIIERLEIYAGERGVTGVDPVVRAGDLAAALAGTTLSAASFGAQTLSGGTPALDTDTDHDVSLSAGAVVLTDGEGNYKLFSRAEALVKQIDAAWATGGERGGLPSGLTLSASTMYPMHWIGNDIGRLDAGFDTDATAANLRADAGGTFRWYAPVRGNFAVFTDGSKNILGFVVKHNLVLFAGAQADVADTTLADNVYETATLTAPANTPVIIEVDGRVGSNTSGAAFMVKDKTSGIGVQFSRCRDSDNPNTLQTGSTGIVCTDANRQIDYAIDALGGAVTPTHAYINTIAWFLEG